MNQHRAAHIAEAVIAAVLILGPAVTIGIAFDTKSGTIASWVAALATTGALIAAVYAGRQAAQLVKVESDRDRKTDLQQRRAQADLVAVWITEGYKTTVVNLSNIPVYDAELYYTAGDYQAFRSAAVMSPSERSGREITIHNFKRAYDCMLDELAEGEKAPRARIAISFRDAAGTRWIRDHTGVMHEIGPTA